MTVVKCGTRVKIQLSNIEGTIIQISLRFKEVSYEVAYFTNNDRKSIWLNESEFRTEFATHNKIGFSK